LYHENITLVKGFRCSSSSKQSRQQKKNLMRNTSLMEKVEEPVPSQHSLYEWQSDKVFQTFIHTYYKWNESGFLRTSRISSTRTKL